MKRAILYLFLFTYSTVMLKPAMPYIGDAVAHILFYKNHMATVHAHNGKYHAHTEMAEAAKNEQQNKGQHNTKKDTTDSDQIITEAYAPNLPSIAEKRLSYSISAIPIIFISHDSPPPKA